MDDIRMEKNDSTNTSMPGIDAETARTAVIICVVCVVLLVVLRVAFRGRAI